MIGLEYRLVQPNGEPIPFAPWFARGSEGRVFALDFTLDEHGGSGYYLPQPTTMMEDLMALPAPAAKTWRAARLREHDAVEARWSEPIYPGVFSPMAVAHRSLGAEAICALTITRDEVRHRIAIPDSRDLNVLWPHLAAEVTRYCGFSAVNVRLELLRLRRLLPMGAEGTVAELQRRLFEFGGFDITDIEAAARAASFLGMTPREFCAGLGIGNA